MPGSPVQPLASVHQFHGERPATEPVSQSDVTLQRVPVSLQQPHLTEHTLQKMPVTSIGGRESQQAARQETQQATADSQALLVASGTAGLLLPGALASLFCRSGPPAETPPSTPARQSVADLRPYPRELLQIVSSVRGSVGGQTSAAAAVSAPPDWQQSVLASPGTGPAAGPCPPAGVMADAPPQTVREPAVAAEVSSSLSAMEKRVTAAAVVAPLTAMEKRVAAAVVALPVASVTASPPAAHDPSLVGPSAAADTSDQSDTSTATPEPADVDADAAADDDDDRMSVVSTGSAWSDISGFEEDIWRLRSVLRDPTAPPQPPPGHAQRQSSQPSSSAAMAASEQQLHLHRLQLQLQHASQERELYRGQLEALQGQMTGGSQLQLFEVRRQKAHLDGVLEVTRRELDEAAAERAELRSQLTRCQLELRAADAGSMRTERDALWAELAPLRVRARDLETRLTEASGKIETRDAEVAMARDEIKRSEAGVTVANLALEKARREAEGRDATVVALKAKVAELVVDAQQRLQERLQAESAGQALREELGQLERSRDWYRTQLKTSQDERLQQQQGLMAAQTQLITQRNMSERLRGELALAQQAAAGAKTRAVREKESLLRHLENIRADMLQREALFKTAARQQSAPALSTGVDCARELDQANSSVRSLELEVAELRQQGERSAEELAAAVRALAQQESLYRESRFSLAASQEKLSQQNTLFETLKLRSQDNAQELDQMRAQLKEGAAAKQQLKDEKTQLEVALASANQEKRDVDDAARRLTAELKKMSASFYKLKNDVSAKEKHIDELQTALTARESELRTSRDKLDEAGRLKVRAEQLTEKMQIFDSMNEQNKQLMVTNHELRYKVQQLTQDRSVLDRGRLKLEEVVRSLQQQANEAAQREAGVKVALDERDRVIKDLEEEAERSKQELVAVKTYARNAHRNGEIPDCGEDAVAETHLTANHVMLPVEESVNAVNHNLIESPDDTKPPEPEEEMRRQISLLSVQNRELERRLAVTTDLSRISGHSDSEPAQSTRLEQENATLVSQVTSLTTQVTSLTAQLQRALADAEGHAAARRRNENHSAVLQQLREQLQLSQTRNKQLQQQLVAAKRADGPSPPSQLNGSLTATADEAGGCRQLEDQLAAAHAGYKERHRCYQSNIRVLTRKLREYMRSLKAAEQQLAESRAAGAPDAGRRAVQLEEAGAQQARQLDMAQREAQRARQELKLMCAKADDAQLLSLEVEKERGRLEGMAQSYTALQKRAAELEALLAGYDEQRQTALDQSPAQERRLQLQLQQLQQQLTQEQLDGKELRRLLFAERRETSRLKKDVSSLQCGLQTAEELVQSRHTQVAERQAALDAAGRHLAEARGQLSDQRAALDTARRQTAEVRRRAEHSAANDPVLAQQIKTLSGHLHQKNAELKGLHEQCQLVEQRHLVEVDGLKRSLLASADELQQLKSRLDTTREEKFGLQTQVTELRSALQTSSEQSRDLRTQVSALEARLGASDRTLCLPAPAPSPMDEALIRRLLEQSEPEAESRPLDDLQACLHSLKQEMTALQTQIQQTDTWPSLPDAARLPAVETSPGRLIDVTSSSHPTEAAPVDCAPAVESSDGQRVDAASRGHVSQGLASPRHQKRVTPPDRQVAVTSADGRLGAPPSAHQPGVTSPDRQSGLSSAHQQGVTSPDRQSGVTAVDHRQDMTSPGHQQGMTSLESALQLGIAPLDHDSNMASPDRQPGLTSPDHQPGMTSVDHQPGMPSPGHQPGMTSVDHQPDMTSPVHQPGVTSPVHQPSVTSPGHQPGVTSVGHLPGMTSVDHQPDMTSPVHQPGVTSPVHQPGVTPAVPAEDAAPDGERAAAAAVAESAAAVDRFLQKTRLDDGTQSSRLRSYFATSSEKETDV